MAEINPTPGWQKPLSATGYNPFRDTFDVPVPKSHFTSGEFATEADIWEPFDRLMGTTGAFKIFNEVPGEYVQPRPGTEDKGAKIDRLIIPTLAAYKAGWTAGAFGIEGKKSGTKIGRAISQAIDYTRCVFELNDTVPGLLIMPRWVFIYPCPNIGNDLGSIMAQNRIGTCEYGRSGLWFQCGGIHALEIQTGGSFIAKSINIGNKRGSR